jgi:hypothetical protein
MAWTAPRTWVSGETLTAALLNTHLRDNLLETAPAKVTTAGDLTYATGANALARLGITNGGVLKGGASAPSWIAPGAAGAILTISGGAPAWTPGVNGVGDLFYVNGSGVVTWLPVGVAGKLLSPSSGVPAWLSLTCTRRVYTSNATWSKPAGLLFATIDVTGGGAGGGGVADQVNSSAAAGAGGGAGANSRKLVLAASLGSSETVTVGAAGSGGSTSGGNGGNGGDSSFGSHCSAAGGNGGTGMSGTATSPASRGAVGGFGGAASDGDVNVAGEDGDGGWAVCIASTEVGARSGRGGSSRHGSGGGGLATGASLGPTRGAGLDGVGYGAGGGGAIAINGTGGGRAGGAGTAGLVIVEEWTIA